MLREDYDSYLRVFGLDQEDTTAAALDGKFLIPLKVKKQEAIATLTNTVNHALDPGVDLQLYSDPLLKSLHGDAAFDALVTPGEDMLKVHKKESACHGKLGNRREELGPFYTSVRTSRHVDKHSMSSPQPIICFMSKADVAVKIVPSEDGAFTVVSVGEQLWRKRHSSMEDATREAAEMAIMTPNEKRLADMSQPLPTYAQGFAAPSVQIDVDELIKRGFLPDA